MMKYLLVALGVVSMPTACTPPDASHTDGKDAPPIAVDSTAARPFVFGEARTFRSDILKQDRTINVYLPDGYSPDSARTYPVILVLDGSANEDFPHIAGLAQFMNMYDLLPKSIVVGIANVDRRHDFTHPTEGDSDLVWVPTGGGSAPFIQFLDEELLPFVDKHYKTDGHRGIIGQSLGGLLCVEVLFTRPELFDDYIIVSPSLWWDNGSLARSADVWVRDHPDAPKNVFVALGTEGDDMARNMDVFTTAFKKHAKPPLNWTYAPLPEESHATILHRAVYRAFEWLNPAPKEV